MEAAPGTSGWSALFWEAFARSSNPMVLLDEDRRHVDVNKAYLKALGYPRSRVIGHPMYEFIADAPMYSLAEWKTALREKELAGTAELVRQNGERLTVEFAGHPEVVTGKRLILVVAMRVARSGRRASVVGGGSEPNVPLTRREREIVRLIALGLTGPEIADELTLAHNTVRTHVNNAMNKLSARSRAHLVAISLADALAG